MSTAIRTTDLRVDYGEFTAVHDLSFEIAAGEVFGLIGPNGAGKTSTIRVLATLQEPTYGEAFVGGFDCVEQAAEVRRILGYMPDFAPVYETLEVWEMLDMFAAAHGLEQPARRRRVDDVIERVDLVDKRKARCGALSRGMKQRLVLGKTLLHEPTVLLLDEPASGLDPRARIEMRQVLKGLAAEGRTVLVSSHILTELAGLCDSIGIMDHGRMVEHGRIDDIIERMQPRRLRVIDLLEPAADDLLARLETLCGEAPTVETPTRLVVSPDDASDAAAADLLTELVRSGARVTAFYERRLDVEGVFMALGAKSPPLSASRTSPPVWGGAGLASDPHTSSPDQGEVPSAKREAEGAGADHE